MISYEDLTQEVPIIYDDNAVLPTALKGIFIESNVADIILLKRTIDTDTERKCILAEELGHYYLTVRDITDQSKLENQQQELRARQWGYEKLVPLP
ncbi:ImmA/IrrE family metallo-endopeptidase [Paenibacillus lutimineralis]|uniref:ImmA/IrrE family metallo-endopeptidase n=1 Tax=Paenibacillus lutimineralis TaxID=2707005 RepID=UPI001D0484DC|nr:ImmA/IrrE family metallo-endopeptidase [Paenibacillus lutimineralis]